MSYSCIRALHARGVALNILVILALAVIVSHYFGRTCVLIAIGLGLLFFLDIHGVVLPRYGVNGWTAEPREKYYALRGWPLDD